MDDNGNILARRYAKSGIFVKTVGNPSEENAIGNEILKCQNFNLELEKVMKVRCLNFKEVTLVLRTSFLHAGLRHEKVRVKRQP